MQTVNPCCTRKTHSPLKSSENCQPVWMQTSPLLLVPIVLASFCRVKREKEKKKRATTAYIQIHCRPRPPLHSKAQANQIGTLLRVPGAELSISAWAVADCFSVPSSSWNLSLCFPGSERWMPLPVKSQDSRLGLTLYFPKLQHTHTHTSPSFDVSVSVSMCKCLPLSDLSPPAHPPCTPSTDTQQ